MHAEDVSQICWLIVYISPTLTATLAWWLRRMSHERKIWGSIPACAVGICPGHTSDLKMGILVATLPGAWHYRVSIGTDWPGVSIRRGEVENLICNFYLSVAAHKLVWADPSLRYTSILRGHKPTNQQTNNSPLCFAYFTHTFLCHIHVT